MGTIDELAKRVEAGTLQLVPELQAARKARRPPPVIRFTHPPAQPAPAKTAGSDVAPAGWIAEIQKRLEAGTLELTPQVEAARKAHRTPPPAQAATAGVSLTPLGAAADIGRAAHQRMFANMPDWMKYSMATTEVQGLGELLGGWFARLPAEEKLKLRREQEERSRRNAEDQEFRDGFLG